MTPELPKPSLLVIIPPPVWALAFVLAGWRIGEAIAAPMLFRNTVIGWIAFAIGVAVAASGRLAFLRAGTEVLPASRKNSALVTTGLFARTRNPMYVGLIAAALGLAVVIGAWTAYAAVLATFLFVNFISIPYEEEKMERQFGDEYRAYKKRVRPWI